MSGCFNTVFPKEIDEFLSGPKLAKDGHVELDSIFSQDPKVKIDVENPLLDSEKLSRQAIKEGLTTQHMINLLTSNLKEP